MMSESEAIARAHAIYTPFALSFYDFAVHGLSNRFAWQCPTSRILDLYISNLSADHLEAGVGTGLFLDQPGAAFERLVVMDINRHCLDRAAKRLARFHPRVQQANLLSEIQLDDAPFKSVGLTYVLHCLPGSMHSKLSAVDHLKPLMADDGVLFGATILGRGIAPNSAARALLDLYNRKGVFNNRDDDLDTLTNGLKQRFSRVAVEQYGLVALFRAS